MQYGKILPARFLSRPNRFVARVEAEGEELVCHVKNTGRCRELLVPGATVWLEESPNPSRKTKFDLIAVEKGDRLINMDAQAPNKVFGEWAAAGGFREGLTLLRPETTYRSSRFDFYWESSKGRGFVEVKGVTLEEDGVVRFPDAPTLRGVKHLDELVKAHEAGYEAAVCFVIQMENVRWFAPNDVTHPEFGQALRRAAQAGVEILAMDCAVTPQSLTMGKSVPIRL
ncbi:MAG: DNA/RNA nuclease SfsA [Flintibacter sp.]|uniref:DNA/RNA nuclease SfsA n=1 Tax=Flintibacter sp. TaxID=1918624 RepID=UPI0026737674|nr:DNA/RNA nuclease SfsA [Flintibacter sp.]MCI6151475.1 DNA/RNA nuclease SfsA [Flintibacter sp.]MDD7116300.1 DNA/RNA nuclease SfsA [Flintibacter sp.]MDY5039357.1 DNA/RNA nuclease SfsA [Lawsonibacter sp.]